MNIISRHTFSASYASIHNNLLTKIKQAYVFAKTLNLRKSWNLVIVIAGYIFSLIARRPFVWGRPLTLSIEPTNVCNLSCPECPTGAGTSPLAKGFLSTEIIDLLEDDLSRSVLSVNLFFQGEPFLHPGIFSIIGKVARKAYTIISTNGHFIPEQHARQVVESGLHELIFSVDGYDQQSYERYRVGGSFTTVLQAIAAVVTARRELLSNTPVIVVQCLIFSHTQDHLSRVSELARSLGADKVVFKSAQFYDASNARQMLPSQQFSRYTFDNNGHLVIKSPVANRCWRSWSGAVVTHQGMLLPCCFDKSAAHSFGSVTQSDVFGIWKGAKRTQFLRNILADRKKINMCENCTEGLRL